MEKKFSVVTASARQDALVIGAGVIGCAIARELSKHGLTVSVLESNVKAGQEASGAAGGILLYKAESDLPDRWHALASQAIKYHHRLSDELRSTPFGLDWNWAGYLELDSYSVAARSESKRPVEKHRLGSAETLDERAISKLEPAISSKWESGRFYEDAGAVNPSSLVKSLLADARQRGATFYFGRHLDEFVFQGTRIAGVRAGGDDYIAKYVIVATGAWSSTFRQVAPIYHVYPETGQALYLDLGGEKRIFRTVSWDGVYVLPRGDGIFIGATKELRGFERGDSSVVYSSLLPKAVLMLPFLDGAPSRQRRLYHGFRPYTKSRIPIMGPDRTFDGLWWATGHGSNGILLAPITASLVADGIAQGKLSNRLTTT